jgi:dihydropteroate synthase-like protein
MVVTGRLARPRLERVLQGLGETEFQWSIQEAGVKIAALMTEAILLRRLPHPIAADRVVLPGRCRVDLERLSRHFEARFERGPDELKDLPKYLGRRGLVPDLSRHDTRIFAEIVEAPNLTVEDILTRADAMRRAGADVIDLGCLPDTPFPRLEEAVTALKAGGFKVSVDSAETDELRRGAKAGADVVLSLTKDTLHLAEETGVEAVLIPAVHGEPATLYDAVEEAGKRGIRFIADPILDPIHFGFTDSLLRYVEFRRRYPEAEMLMGTGNLTELTDADSGGVTAVLMGVCSELRIRNVLVVQVSPHTRRTVEEHDAARRIMFAARAEESLPKDYGPLLLGLHDRSPYYSTPEEIAEIAAEVRDQNFRIEVAEDGIHVYNSKAHHVAHDAMSLFPTLDVLSDGPHAFYLGTELMKAEMAFRLGKRYSQDEPLAWGVAADSPAVDKTRLAEAGHTLRAKRGA